MNKNMSLTEYITSCRNNRFDNILKKHYINYEQLSYNPGLTWDIIKNNLDKPWKWVKLSFHKNITWDIIQQNKDCPWDYDFVCKNPNVTWDIIQKNSATLNSYSFISKNPNITWDIISKNLNKGWDWSYLSETLSLEIISNNLKKKKCYWKWYFISQNSNLTLDFIKANITRDWDWRLLHKKFNIFEIENIELYVGYSHFGLQITDNPKLLEINTAQVLREYFAKKTIVRYWRNAICNPEYSLCRKRLEKEFLEMQ
jgi:hypothetical protein